MAGPTDPPEYPWLYGIPAILFGGGYIAAASTGMAGLVQAGYLASSLLCIGSLSGLASQATARQGNILGILGVSSGILSSLAAVGFAPAVLAQFGGVAMIGSIVGRLSNTTKIESVASTDTFRSDDWTTHHCDRSTTNCRCFTFSCWLSCSIDEYR